MDNLPILSRFIFSVTLLSAWGPFAFAGGDFVYSVRNWESYDLEGREFVSFTLEPDEPWQERVTVFPEPSKQREYTAYDQYAQRLAEFFADGANTFVHQTFVENYPELGFDFFQKLHGGNVMLDGNSSVVVVGLGDGSGRLVKTLASVRIVRRRNGSELTGELKFGVEVEEPSRTKDQRIRYGEFLLRNNIMIGPYPDLTGWEFSTIELANLAVAPESRDISMSLLTRAMGKILVSGGHYFTNNIRLVAYDRLILFCSEKLVEPNFK